MKTKFMNRYFLGAAMTAMFAANVLVGQTVQSTVARQNSVSTAQRLLDTKEVSALPDGVNPFYSTAFAEAMGNTIASSTATTPTHAAGPRTERDILAGIAGTMKPSGYFVLGGQPTLVFGQKRVKAGSTMTINFEGSEYTVEITAIDRTSFTLRLNREEYTRPIK